MSDFFLDPWLIQPLLNQIQRGDEVRRLGSKIMDLLVCLAERPNQPVTKEELIARVWQGEFTTEESLTTAVYELRKALDDDARCPKFVGTVRGRGYRLLGNVELRTSDEAAGHKAGADHSAEAAARTEPEETARTEPEETARNEPEETRSPDPAARAAPQKAPAVEPTVGPEEAIARRRAPLAMVIAVAVALLSLSALLYLRRSPSPNATIDPNGAAAVDKPAAPGHPARIPPSPEAEQETLDNSRSNAAANLYASGPPSVCSVVVVPIESLTADPKSSIFAQSLSEQLAQDLAQSGTLAVVPGYSSVMSGRLSSSLSTDAVVEGSVQSSGTRLWIRMQMVDTLGGRLLWGGTYAHDLGNSLDLQQELSQEITQQILKQIEPVADCAGPGFERPSSTEPS